MILSMQRCVLSFGSMRLTFDPGMSPLSVPPDGCRIGGEQVHGIAALDQPQGQGRGDRRRTQTALAHHHD
jgi:hypothetical protein